ncbi:hypothetical protein HMPREF0990_00098 [Lachnospiraceae bacterium 1_1_57FAA]|nr:hypothetical protein HMPREF0990_00098 [Lachnospiraceae bacterium 1_1_57FAA]
MLYIILFLISIAGGYVAFRYISLLRALKQIQKELDVIQQDLSKNQMIHLPVPNNRLKELLITINSFLDELHHERARYTKQEKEFQKQIENISHDLRTPLTSLLGYVRLYKKSQSSYISQNAELSDTLDVIERKSESLKNLITQFYDFSRLTAHDYTVNLIKIDTVKLLRESFADNCHILEETHLNVSLDLPDRPIYVLADKTALERIFFNLFQNAGRYAHTFFHITIKTNKIPLKSCSLMTHVLFHPKIFLICSTASIFRNRRAVRAEPDLVLRLPDHLQKRSAESFLFLPKSQTEITLFSSHLLWHYLLVSFKTFIPDFPFVNTYPRSHPIMYV